MSPGHLIDHLLCHNCHYINITPYNILDSCSGQSGQNISINQISHELNLRSLIDLRENFINKPIIEYLNINSLVSKINDPREVCKKLPTDVLCLDETKFDDSCPGSQLKIMIFNILLFEEIKIDMGK